MKTLSLACALFLAAFILSCNAGDKPGAETTTQKSTGAKVYLLSSVSSRKDNSMMADFAWSEGGKSMSLSQLAKDHIVLLNFWGTWCPPCRHELPDIVQLSKEMEGKVIVIGVALERNKEADANIKTLSNFITQNGIPYINVTADASTLNDISNAWGGISAVPTTFIINKSGKIVSSIRGGTTKDAFMQELKKAM